MTDAPASPADVEELLRALDDVQEELRQLTEDRADLLASAERWADLYAASVDRANAAEALLQRLADVPADVQRYYALLDTIAVLTEAVENLVRDCAECAGAYGGHVLERAPGATGAAAAPRRSTRCARRSSGAPDCERRP